MDHHTLRIVKKSKDWVVKCVSCDQTMPSLEQTNIHIQKSRHLSRLRTNWSQYALTKIHPTSAVLKKLNEFLEAEVVSNACKAKVLKQRDAAYEKISAKIINIWPEASVNMVGSSYHGMGLANSDLNISVGGVNDEATPIATMSALFALTELFETHKNDFANFERHFSEEKKPPFMSFLYEGRLPCTVLILNDTSHRLAKLLKEYGKIDDRCRKLCILFRKWAYMCSIDGLSEGCWPSHAVYLLVVYFLQQLPDPVLPVLHELIATPNGTTEVYENVTDLVRAGWKTKNSSNLATLWVQLLKFYCLEFDAMSHIVCITQRQKMTRNSAGAAWSGKRIAIMDPYVPDKNVARTVCNSTVYDFMMHCLRTTCLYFCIPQTDEGPIFGTVRPPPTNDKNLDIPGYGEFLELQLRLAHYIVKLIPAMDTNYHLDKNTDKAAIIEKMLDLKGLYVNTCLINLDDFNNMNVRDKPEKLKYANYCLFLDDAQYLVSRVNAAKLHYTFSFPVFTGGEQHPRCCIICSKNGHNQNTCPELMLEKIVDVPLIDKELLKLVDKVCRDVYTDSKPTKKDLDKKDSALTYLQQYIEALFPTACLTLFGSSMNGFGLKNSDMDICLTFENCPSSTGIPASALNNLFKHMKKCQHLRKQIFVQHAKVPIIKFLHAPTQLEGDISLYNILAQENTKLLRTYSEIDERVKILGYMVKRFARVCNVGDASKGSLSSYCYVLMMLYFLQNCSPPVIPVLQALPKQANLPKKFIDGCNTYFFDDISKLPEVWPAYQQNNKSSGELWIEFLRFYTEKFDIENYVVSIRSEEPLLKLEKRWFTKVFAIEDPFNHSHNLGSGLTLKMNMFIIKAFRNARMLFTSKIKANGNKTLSDSYFDVKILAKNEPPNDRGCRICKSIGHKAKECPQRHTSQGRAENENHPPNRDRKFRQEVPPNERFTKANQMLFNDPANQIPPRQIIPGPSQFYQPNQQNQFPNPFNSGPFNRYNPPPAHSNSRAQIDSHQMIINSLFSKSKATGKKSHK